MSNIIYLNVSTTLDIPPDKVLEDAIGKLESVLLIGRDKNGELVIAASLASKQDNLWDIEQAKKFLLEYSDELEE